jgi:hypothetical protein
MEELKKRLQECRAAPDAPLRNSLRTCKGEEDSLLTTRNAETNWTVTLTQIGE